MLVVHAAIMWSPGVSTMQQVEPAHSWLPLQRSSTAPTPHDAAQPVTPPTKARQHSWGAHEVAVHSPVVTAPSVPPASLSSEASGAVAITAASPPGGGARLPPRRSSQPEASEQPDAHAVTSDARSAVLFARVDVRTQRSFCARGATSSAWGLGRQAHVICVHIISPRPRRSRHVHSLHRHGALSPTRSVRPSNTHVTPLAAGAGDSC